MFCAWCFVLLLFRAVLNEQYDWRTEWKPRGMCAAMQTSIYCKREKRTYKTGIKKETDRAVQTEYGYAHRRMIKAINRIFERYQPQTIVMEDTYAGKDMYAYKKALSSCRDWGLIMQYKMV